MGSSEHFALPKVAPQLREVNAYLGWFGPLSRPMQVVSMGTTLPGMSNLLKALGKRFVKGSTGGPDAEARSKSGSQIVAIAYDSGGRELAEAQLTGIDGYTFTGRILAWGAQRAAEGALKGTGALGPVDGFGLAELTEGCRWAGLEEKGAVEQPRACGCQVTPRRAGAWGCSQAPRWWRWLRGRGWDGCRDDPPPRPSVPRARRCARRWIA